MFCYSSSFMPKFPELSFPTKLPEAMKKVGKIFRYVDKIRKSADKFSQSNLPKSDSVKKPSLAGRVSTFCSAAEVVNIPDNVRDLLTQTREELEEIKHSKDKVNIFHAVRRTLSAIAGNLAGAYAAFLSMDQLFKDDFGVKLGIKDALTPSAVGVFAVPFIFSTASFYSDVRRLVKTGKIKKTCERAESSSSALQEILNKADKYSNERLKEAFSKIDKYYLSKTNKTSKLDESFKNIQFKEQKTNANNQIKDWKKNLRKDKEAAFKIAKKAWLEMNIDKEITSDVIQQWIDCEACISRYYQQQEEKLKNAEKAMKFSMLTSPKNDDIKAAVFQARLHMAEFAKLRSQKDEVLKTWDKYVLNPVNIAEYKDFKNRFDELYGNAATSWEEKQKLEAEAKLYVRRFGYCIKNYGKEVLGRKLSRKTLKEMLGNEKDLDQAKGFDQIKMSELRKARFENYYNKLQKDPTKPLDLIKDKLQLEGKTEGELDAALKTEILKNFLNEERDDLKNRITEVVKRVRCDLKLGLGAHFCNTLSFILSVTDITEVGATVLSGTSFALSLYRGSIQIPDIHDKMV